MNEAGQTCEKPDKSLNIFDAVISFPRGRKMWMITEHTTDPSNPSIISMVVKLIRTSSLRRSPQRSIIWDMKNDVQITAKSNQVCILHENKCIFVVNGRAPDEMNYILSLAE